MIAALAFFQQVPGRQRVAPGAVGHWPERAGILRALGGKGDGGGGIGAVLLADVEGRLRQDAVFPAIGILLAAEGPGPERAGLVDHEAATADAAERYAEAGHRHRVGADQHVGRVIGLARTFLGCRRVAQAVRDIAQGTIHGCLRERKVVAGTLHESARRGIGKIGCCRHSRQAQRGAGDNKQARYAATMRLSVLH